jgi:hypothetical protein
MINSLTIKLASIAVHAEEFFSPRGHPMDQEAIRGLLADSEVRSFLDDKKNAVLLPLKRHPTKEGSSNG